ncbi:MULTISPECIES: DUF5994 family protein [Nocardia]|uniref:DUF5994 family protein n=1 Tax=Nocardia TaxID=1817 RepID=UPI0018962F2C|nr:DUF5994 family protein [Nocardia blacklockiae]MBF6172352.1 hypothetical protein [Nocardia blacklockiae]
MLLKADSAKTGYVDGAWWPYSGDLAAELPTVLTPLAARLGTVHRVTYRLHEWPSAPAELVFAGQVVRLDGFSHGTVHTVEVSGPRDRRLVLLVVAPGTPAHRAFSVLTSASGKNNESTVEELLMIGRRARAVRTGRAAALRRWRRELEARRIGWTGGAGKERS